MAPRPAIFGKLPRHGDFICRGLDDEMRERWDAWASAEILAARAALADDLDAAHESAPSWRFMVRDDAEWAVGATAPSVDASGRRFFIMAQVGGLALAEALGGGADLGARVEQALYRGLAERLDGEALLQATAEATQALDAPANAAIGSLGPTVGEDGVWWTLGGATRAPAMAAGRWPPAGALLCGAMEGES